MSSQETKKTAAKFGKFGSKKPSAKFAVPKLTKPKEEAPAVSIDAKPQPKKKKRPDTEVEEPTNDKTEELPEEELLDEEDLEELDDSDLVEEKPAEAPAPATEAPAEAPAPEAPTPTPTPVAARQAEAPATAPPAAAASLAPVGNTGPVNETIKITPQQKPVDPYGATAAMGPGDVAALKAHKAAAEAAAAESGVVAGVLGGDLPGISADPLAAAAPPRPVTNEEAEAAAAVAALDGLDDGSTIERSMSMAAQPAPTSGQYAAQPAPTSGQYAAQPGPPSGQYAAQAGPPSGQYATQPGPTSSGPFPAVNTPYPGYVPTPLPQQSPFHNQTPMPQQAPPPDPMAVDPKPGTMEAARKASWKQAHPSARRWARKRDSHTGSANRRTPRPLRIIFGMLLIGVGVYLLAIFVPEHSPDGPRESEQTEAGKIWRFSETQHTLATGLSFALVGLGLFGMISGAFYRREITAKCKKCNMKVEATREGFALRCHNGGHKAGVDTMTVGMLASFVVVGLGTLILLLTASLG